MCGYSELWKACFKCARFTPAETRSNDEYADRIPNPKHTPKYTEAKVPHIQDKHAQLTSFAELMLLLPLPYKKTTRVTSGLVFLCCPGMDHIHTIWNPDC